MSIAAITVAKMLLLFAVAFVVTVLWTPLLTHYLYKYKLGKSIRSDTDKTPLFTQMHQHKSGTPTMGGVLIWVTTLVLTLASFYLPLLAPRLVPAELNFLSRSETLLPLGVLVASAVVGLVDDFVDVRKLGPAGGGLNIRVRLLVYSAIAAVAAWWFVAKLEWHIFHVPFVGDVQTTPAVALIAFFIVIVATSFSVNETDGLDGLAGGVLMIAFSILSAISFVQGRFDLATFCAVVSGALLAFLWFNIHPARFFMGDTGSMALGTTLAVISIMTNTVWLLPVFGFILVMESASVLIQWTSKALRNGKKVFRSTPIHHHFEAIGWEEPKIVMRAWIISAVMTMIGFVLFLVDRSILGLF